MNPTNKQQETGAVLCAGLFIVVTGNEASAHIVPEDQVPSIYSRMAMAADCRNVETAMQQATCLAFRVKDADFALPAHTKGKLEDLMIGYNGQAKDAVRVLAARWLAGLPFTSLDDDEGAPDRIPEPPTAPHAPAGSDEPESIKPQLEQAPSADSLSLDGLLALASR